MVTRIPDVRVSRIEANQGFLVTCNNCPNVRTILPTRQAADQHARAHRAAHQTPDPLEQDWAV